ncbi:MAG TPA: glycogen-binding domain-containing protein, partial [Pyrinomonadaceae bacterium]|nr:glycogen-binding domain-containing protein [Pyrinomonadaceae bacterium]
PSLVKKRKLVQKSRSRFLDEVAGTSYVFNKDADGNYSSLTFEYEGTQYTAQRVVLPPPSLTGNTTFRLQGYADASLVTLAGTFNNWDQSLVVCGREGNAWVCRLDLEPGEYAYKFIVDGNWVLDPDNPNTTEDEAGNTNNVLVKK